MIAVSSSGKSFRALAAYLERGRTGVEIERIAWSEGRNLATNDPTLAAAIMRASAATRDERVVQPVFHVVVSFDPHDRPTELQMRGVATRLLADLGLADHQALVVAHRDRAHRHLHIVVNRIHPETGVAWDRWQEQVRTQRSLRAQEKALGFRQVAGRLHHVDGRDVPEQSALTTAELRQKTRTSEPLFVERMRGESAAFRAARSWDELETTLAARGLRLERKEQGLVITDGRRAVKASRVHRDLSLRQLEVRYGVVYVERHHRPSTNRHRAAPAARDRTSPSDRLSATHDGAGLRARYVAVRLRQFERAIRLEHALSAAGALVDRAEARMRVHQAALTDLDAARAAFVRSLARMYRDPAAAREAFAAVVAREDVARAVAQLRERPERFGALIDTERPQRFLGGFGNSRTADMTAALQGAVVAADRAARMLAAAQAMPSDAERQRALLAVTSAQARHERLRDLAEQLPLRSRLAGNLARGMQGLSTEEWASVRRSLTARQMLIGDVLRDAGRADRLRGERQLPRGERGTVRGSPRRLHHRSRVVGAAVHRTMTQVAPRELRHIACAVAAVSHPSFAVKQLIMRTVREAIFGAREPER